MATANNWNMTGWTQQSSSPILDSVNPNNVRNDASNLWTATATVKHSNSDNLLSFVTPHIVISSTQTVKIQVSRPAGLNGACSVTIQSFNVTGDCATLSGTHYTALSQVVAFADGETGIKEVDLVVTNMAAAGLHLIGVEMVSPSNCIVHHPRVYVHLDDGGVNTSATSVTSAIQSTLEETINAASAGTLIYMRDTSGAYTYNNRTDSQSDGGNTVNTRNGTQSAPIIIAGYPGESPVIDQENAGTHDGSGVDDCAGFYLIGSSHFVWFMDIEITNTSTSGILSKSGPLFPDGLNVIRCHIHDLANQLNEGKNWDNLSAIRLDDASNLVVFDCSIHNIYDPNLSSNPIDSVPLGLHAGIHGYRLEASWIVNNTFDVCSRHIYHKRASMQDPGTPRIGHHISRNLFLRCSTAVIYIGVQGGGDTPAKDIIVEHNVAVQTVGPTTDFVRIVYKSDVIAQPTGLFVFNNTVIGGYNLFYAQTMEEIVSYSNVIQSSSSVIQLEQDLTYNTSLEYSDYNMMNNISAGDSKIAITDRNGGANTYSSLSAWNDAFNVDSDPQLARDMDENSIETAPTFTDSANDDYTTTTGNTQGAGRFSRDIGIGSVVVGSSI